MNIKKIEGAIEALLFASGEALSVEKISYILDVDKTTLASVMRNFVERYNDEKHGIRIVYVGEKYQLATRGEFAEYIQKIVEPKRRNPLSKAALEVLSVVSYKQPVTRATIEHIRGVNCDYPLSRLIELGLVENVGKLDAPGKPSLFGTTDEFLRSFGINSLKDMPLLQDYDIDDAILEATQILDEKSETLEAVGGDQ